MSTRRSDAASAALAVLAVCLAGRARGWSLRNLLFSKPFVLGAGAAFAIEVGIARWPEHGRRLWHRPAVRFGSPVGLVATAVLVGRHRGSAPLAAVLGGLVGYFLLLAGIGSGAVSEPATWFEEPRREDRSGIK